MDEANRRRSGGRLVTGGAAGGSVEIVAGQEHGARGGSSPFLFDGDALALDLVNTEIVVRGRSVDLLAAPAALVAWWVEASRRRDELAASDPPPAPDPRLLPAVKALRRSLRALFGAVADQRPLDPTDLADLNRILAVGYQTVELGPDGRPHAVERSREVGPAAALLPVARSARWLLTEADPARLHRCQNERCVLLFYDRTKNATRRWCSVACMNRARSAARYRARLTGLDIDPDS
jgi:predicted RNA-binding Zn ribbon-like protein